MGRVLRGGAHSGTRKVAMRSAIVMSADHGSPFAILLGLVRRGLGERRGRGEQFVSWIHEADFISAVEFLYARKDLEGVVNLAAPNPLPNRQWMRTLREAWDISFGLTATTWMLELGTFLLRTETELALRAAAWFPQGW